MGSTRMGLERLAAIIGGNFVFIALLYQKLDRDVSPDPGFWAAYYRNWKSVGISSSLALPGSSSCSFLKSAWA